MVPMTARQPRRARRRVAAPAASLPRPVAGAEGSKAIIPNATRRATPGHHREHHVTKDYSYVRRDLAMIGILAAVTTGFIVAMWAIL